MVPNLQPNLNQSKWRHLEFQTGRATRLGSLFQCFSFLCLLFLKRIEHELPGPFCLQRFLGKKIVHWAKCTLFIVFYSRLTRKSSSFNLHETLTIIFKKVTSRREEQKMNEENILEDIHFGSRSKY